MTFDVDVIRKDFPILDREVHGVPLVYLDSANTSQKPRVVLDALTDYYERHNANVARAVHALGSEATTMFEDARDTVAAFVNAPEREEIVFTKNSSEALNLVAYCMSNAATTPGAERCPDRPRRRDRRDRDGAPQQSRPVAAAGPAHRGHVQMDRHRRRGPAHRRADRLDHHAAHQGGRLRPSVERAGHGQPRVAHRGPGP